MTPRIAFFTEAALLRFLCDFIVRIARVSPSISSRARSRCIPLTVKDRGSR
jgi:hypothetical protein